jgi:Protein of unknown function (DUF4239)
MNFFWVYDLPTWQFALMTIGFFVFIAIAGLFVLRKFITSRIMPQAHNDVVSFFMAGLNAIYGITLGLIAVGAWENFNDIDAKVSMEAATMGAIYQDSKLMPAPLRDSIKMELKEYVRYTIQDAWPQQQKGILPKGGTERLTRFQNSLSKWQPENEFEKIVLSTIFTKYNELIVYRRLRLQATSQGLPSAVWYVIFFGAFLNIVICWFFVTDKFRVHIVMMTLFAALLGSLVFLVAAMDNPFRGEFSVSTEAFEIILENMSR